MSLPNYVNNFLGLDVASVHSRALKKLLAQTEKDPELYNSIRDLEKDEKIRRDPNFQRIMLSQEFLARTKNLKVLYLWTAQSELYRQLGRILRSNPNSWVREDFSPYLKYIRLLLNSLKTETSPHPKDRPLFRLEDGNTTARYPEGAVIREDRFISTCNDRETAFNKNFNCFVSGDVLTQIEYRKVLNGRTIGLLSAFPGEGEVLIPPGMCFRVLSVRLVSPPMCSMCSSLIIKCETCRRLKQQERWYVVMEEVDPAVEVTPPANHPWQRVKETKYGRHRPPIPAKGSPPPHKSIGKAFAPHRPPGLSHGNTPVRTVFKPSPHARQFHPSFQEKVAPRLHQHNQQMFGDPQAITQDTTMGGLLGGLSGIIEVCTDDRLQQKSPKEKVAHVAKRTVTGGAMSGVVSVARECVRGGLQQTVAATGIGVLMSVALECATSDEEMSARRVRDITANAVVRTVGTTLAVSTIAVSSAPALATVAVGFVGASAAGWVAEKLGIL